MKRYTATFGHWVHIQAHTPDLCEICGARPKFVENGIKHKYCSRTCAQSGPGPGPIGCKLHGCHSTGKPAFSNFCSWAHAKEAVLLGAAPGCENCNVLPRSVGELCIACDRRPSSHSKSGLRELRVDGRTFRFYRDQFVKEWNSSEPVPQIEKIYEVDVSRDAQSRQNAHRARTFSAAEIRTYHSSQCICNLGNNNPALCSFKSCGICCIVKSSFSSFAFGEPYNNGRFGEGIYSYRNPALADKFATSCTTSPFRVSIGCSVVIESGSVGSDQATSTESVFVASADAILPVCIVVYRK